ncbi:MAG: hypothetical protein ACM3PP_02740 [Candidatus Saccharibacteria bacterium]
MRKQWNWGFGLIIISLMIIFSTKGILAFDRGSEFAGFGHYPPIYTVEGAEAFGEISAFRAIFPDTRPGQEEYRLSIIWETFGSVNKGFEEGGYNSVPIDGQTTNSGIQTKQGRLDLYMESWGVPPNGNQWKTFGFGAKSQSTLHSVWDRDGQKYPWSHWPVYIPPSLINGLSSEQRDQFNKNPQDIPNKPIINEVTKGQVQSWFDARDVVNVSSLAKNGTFHSCYSWYFLPPDLSVKSIKQNEDGTVTAVFYNHSPVAISTKVHMLFKGGTPNEEVEDKFIPRFGTVEWTVKVPEGTKKVLASIGRPASEDRSQWNDYLVASAIKQNPPGQLGGVLFKLTGEDIEYGIPEADYPPKTKQTLRGQALGSVDRWKNNLMELKLADPCTDIAITDAHQMGGENGTKVNQRIGLSVTVTRDNKGPGGNVPVKITLLQGRTELQSAEVELSRNDEYRRTFPATTPSEGGAVTYTFRVEITDPKIKDCDLSNNHRDVVVNVQEPSGRTMEKSYYEVELVR